MATKRKDGRWVVKVRLPGGSVRYVYGSSAAEANRLATKLRMNLEKGERIEAGEQPLRHWAEMYLDQQSLRTASLYMAGIRGRVSWWVERFGEISVKDLVVSDLQAALDSLARKNPHTGKPTGKKTLKDYRADLVRVIGVAVRDRAVSFNPAEYIDIPASAPTEKRFALTEQEQEWIRSTPHRAQLAALIMLGTGVRLGELLALRPADFDLSGRRLSITRAVVQAPGSAPSIKAGGKTDAATRTVPIPQSLIPVLREAFRDVGTMELIYHARDGAPLTQTQWRRIWDSFMLELNLQHGQPLGQTRSKFDPRGVIRTIRPFSPHCLRHTYATALHTAGVDVLTAKEWLGHADVQTTLGIYTHLDDRLVKSDIDKLDSFFA